MRPLQTLYDNPRFWEVAHDRTKPEPFPGKFPTRWRIRFLSQDKNRIIWEYLGKPDPLRIGRVTFLMKHPGIICADEFDKGGVFRAAARMCPRHELVIQSYNPHVSYFYYPWHSTTNGFFDMWETPLYHKKGILDKHSFFYYSPYQEMFGEAQIQRLKEHRLWLRKLNLWK
jgi:hypothetical protein